MLNNYQVRSIQTTYRAAIASGLLVYRMSSHFTRLFVLPTIDHLYGNAIAWKDWFTGDPFAQELKTIISLLFWTLPILLGKTARLYADRYVNQCLQGSDDYIPDDLPPIIIHHGKTVETTGLQRVQVDQPIVTESIIPVVENKNLEMTGLQAETTGLQGFQDEPNPVNQSFDSIIVTSNTALLEAFAATYLPKEETPESTGLQGVQAIDYSNLGIAELRKLARGKMKGASRATKHQCLAILAAESAKFSANESILESGSV